MHMHAGRTFQLYVKLFILAILTGCTSKEHSTNHIVINTEIDSLVNVVSFGDPDVVLGSPYQVVVSGNSVFVSDNAFAHIKKYSIEGQYLGTIGRRGRGPGEFLTINHFGIRDGSILAFDEFQYRSTLFSIDSGSVLATYPNDSDMLWIRDFHWRNDTLALLYAPDVSQYPLSSLNVVHTHVLKSGSLVKQNDYVDLLELYPLEYSQDIAQLIAGFNAGYMLWGDTASYYVPHIFGGKIFAFNGEWILSDSIEVPLHIGVAARSLDHNTGTAPEHATIVSGVRRATGIVDSEIIGVAKTIRNELIVANLINHQDQMKFLYLHIVSTDSVRSIRILDFDPIHIRMNFSFLSLQDVDSSGNLYFIYSWQDDSKIVVKNIRHLLGD